MMRKLTFSALSLVSALGLVWATTQAADAGTAETAKPVVTQAATGQKAPAVAPGKEKSTAAKPAASKDAPATQENKPSGPQSLNGGLVKEIQLAEAKSAAPAPTAAKSPAAPAPAGETKADAKAPATTAPVAKTPAAPVETKAPVAKEGK